MSVDPLGVSTANSSEEDSSHHTAQSELASSEASAEASSPAATEAASTAATNSAPADAASASPAAISSSPKPVGGAMAQLGLVPPGGAMAIIRNQSNPSGGPGAASGVGSAFSNTGSATNTAAGTNGAGAQGGANAAAGQAVGQGGAPQASQQQQAQQDGASTGAVNGAAGGATQAQGANAANGNMPAGLVYPALHLLPVNDTFAPKQISLAPPGPHNRIRIGRQTNAKTVPHPSNGYFDSKVLSRMHAEVWSQDGKVYIKDIKSSNGTFINGDRLSPEAQESEIYELHNEDLVEFGIDIVGDDNKTIIHHKVACRVYLVITAEDALGMRNDFNSLYHGGHRAPLGHSGIGPGAEGGLRRGKNTGMSFDHILSRLQNELQKSRETGSELGGLTSTFGELHDSLGGNVAPSGQPAYQHMVPPLVSESDAAASKSAIEDAKKQSAQVAALQSSLEDTQASLAQHVEKIRTLESMLAEHEQIKAEVGMLKYQMELAKHEVDSMMQTRRKGTREGDDDDFDDGASVASVDTVMQDTADTKPRAAERGASAEATTIAARDAAPEGHVGPAAPPDLPPHLVAKGTEIVDAAPSSAALDEVTQQFEARNAVLTQRLEALESQLEQALSLGRDLKTQHALATETVTALQGRVHSLEEQVAEKVKVIEGTASSMQALEGRWAQWREQIEEGWRQERKGWEEEREHIRSVVRAWDEANRKLEEEVASASTSGSNARAGPSNGGNGKGRKGSKSAKRRAGKRHVNRDLRALLYKPEFNREAGTMAGSSDDDDDDADQKSTSTTTDRSTSSSTGSSGAARSSGKASTAATTPPLTASNASSGSEDGARKGGKGITSSAKKAADAISQKLGAEKGDLPALPFSFKDNAAALPVITAFGVVVVGVAAWALAKKERP